MRGWHYDDTALFEYVEGISDEAAEIEQHVAGCERCEAELAEVREMVDFLRNHALWEPDPPVSRFRRSDLTDILERLSEEDDAAPALCDEILDLPLPWRLQHVRNRVGTRTAGIVKELLQRLRTTLERSPTMALEMTGLAIELADTLDPDKNYRPVSNTILLAGALRSHGDALSFTGNYRDGLAFADRAGALLEEEMPVGAAYELARVAMVRAACLQHFGRAEEAAGLLREAGETFLRYGDRKSSVQARISEGTVLYAMGAVERALEIWGSLEGAPELDELETIRVRQNIALCIRDLGQAGSSSPDLDDTGGGRVPPSPVPPLTLALPGGERGLSCARLWRVMRVLA
jgi:tetratricopeptide (TPR) repeat protein